MHISATDCVAKEVVFDVKKCWNVRKVRVELEVDFS